MNLHYGVLQEDFLFGLFDGAFQGVYKIVDPPPSLDVDVLQNAFRCHGKSLLRMLIIVPFVSKIKGSRDKTVPWIGVDFLSD